MSGEQKHLTIEQIERLLGIQPDSVEKPGESDRLDEARHHLAGCDACQRLVWMERECDRSLRSLKQEVLTPASADCPTVARLYELAAGIIEHEDTDAVLRHAAECDRCGPILRQADELLNAAQTEEELMTLAALKTSQPEWREKFGKTLASASGVRVDAHTPGSLSENIKFHWRLPQAAWAIAISAAILVSILAVAVVRRSRPSYSEALLAAAYSERRTLELRIPGAAHAPLHITRGLQDSSLDKPPSLLEAEHLIATHLRENKSNVDWLEARVRADLLDGNYDSAIRIAEQALDLAPNSSSLLSDLGSAYFERAENQQSALDYGRAYDSLSRSLANNPEDPIVLFNRAVVAERAQLYLQAETDWTHCLRVETDPAWQSEARARLTQLEQKLQEHKDQSQKPLEGPDSVEEALSSGQQERINQIDSIADQYLKLALEEWIPLLTTGRVQDGRRRDSLANALRYLGDDLRARHGDAWLSDFLSGQTLSGRSPAVESLVRAMRANSKGDHENAIQFASDAETEFQKAGSESGRIRAAFETIYSNRLAAHGKPCYEKAQPLIEESHERNYVWIEVQTRLEAAACAVEISRVDESVSRSQEALQLARSSKYGNLQLRATMFAADLLGDLDKRFNLVRGGLLVFWEGRYEPMRGYSFYALMDTSADDLHLWFWDEAAIEEGLQLIATDPNLALRGMERYRLARAQLAVGEMDEARHTSIEAKALLEKSASQTLIAGASIDLAEAFVIKGHYKEALELLVSAEPLVSTFTHDSVSAKYFSTRAAALLGSGQGAEAEPALASALRLARKGLASISEERDRLSWVQTFEPVYRSLAYLQFRRNPESSFRWWESYKGASIRQTTALEDGPQSPVLSEPELPSSASWRSNGTLLLSYATFPDGIAVWAYDGEQVHGIWLAGSAGKIESLARRFFEACADRNSDPNVILQEGRQLYDLLIQPISEWVQGRSRLVIETDDSLQSLPFEALTDERGKYLSDLYEIEYSPGLFYLSTNGRSERVGRFSRALVIGQSMADAQVGLPPLPEALDEARGVAAKFDVSLLLLDHEATFPRIVQELPRAEVFHFAGHAVGNRQLSGLLLAASRGDDGSRFVDVGSFNSQSLHQTRLVVLSGCSTANGIGIGLNDRESLARNVLAAGVPNVVASRWLVDSLATSEWMKVFYGSVIAGEHIGSAAKRARLALRTTKEWRHPFYWATFSAFV